MTISQKTPLTLDEKYKKNWTLVLSSPFRSSLSWKSAEIISKGLDKFFLKVKHIKIGLKMKILYTKCTFEICEI
jgi:hypothetical protein